MVKIIKIAVGTLGAICGGGAIGQQTTRIEAVYVDGFSFNNPIRDGNGLALDAGGAGNGDGAIFQIGYFREVSVSLNPSGFGSADWAAFTPLTGQGSLNAGRHPTTIGDADSGRSGPFGFLFFPGPVAIELDPAIDLGLPDDYPVRLGLRFYDGSVMENCTSYNTVTSDNALWLLQQPVTSPSTSSQLNLDNHLLFWESGAGGSFSTSIALIPEPGAAVLALAGGLVLLRRRRSAAQP